jgi:hypothetical protein
MGPEVARSAVPCAGTGVNPYRHTTVDKVEATMIWSCYCQRLETGSKQHHKSCAQDTATQISVPTGIDGRPLIMV